MLCGPMFLSSSSFEGLSLFLVSCSFVGFLKTWLPFLMICGVIVTIALALNLRWWPRELLCTPQDHHEPLKYRDLCASGDTRPWEISQLQGLFHHISFSIWYICNIIIPRIRGWGWMNETWQQFPVKMMRMSMFSSVVLNDPECSQA